MRASTASTSGERTALVLSETHELAVALRERLDRAYVTVRHARPGEAEAAIADCWPWPWMIVGDLDDPGAAVLTLMRSRPVVVLWQGTHPVSLPAHAGVVSRFADLVAVSERALAGEVGGMRLAIGSGVSLPGGAHAENAELQALISLHPAGFDLAAHRFASAVRALARVNAGWAVTTTGGGVRLAPATVPSGATRRVRPPAKTSR